MSYFQESKHMDIISEENSKIVSENNIKDPQEQPPVELLIQAYHRIRELQTQNQQLQHTVILLERHRKTIKDLQHSLLQKQNCIKNLNQTLLQKNQQIEILQDKCNQAILQFIKSERSNRHNKIQIKRNTNLQDNKLNIQPSSPLHHAINKSNQIQNQNKQASTNHSFKQNTCQYKFNQFPCSNQRPEFTFDVGRMSGKILKNPSTSQMNRLLNKIQKKQQNVKQKEKLKNFHNLCSSIQKRHSHSRSFSKISTNNINYTNSRAPPTLKFAHSPRNNKISQYFDQSCHQPFAPIMNKPLVISNPFTQKYEFQRRN